jgi:hypothetical protein
MQTQVLTPQRANEITLEAIFLARRDGRTPGEVFAIYEREITRRLCPPPAPAYLDVG